MKIVRLETGRVEEKDRAVWVRIHTDEGHLGLGETWYGAEAVEGAIHELFAPLLVGRDPRDIERHWFNMFRLADHWGYGGAETRAISAIDILEPPSGPTGWPERRLPAQVEHLPRTSARAWQPL